MRKLSIQAPGKVNLTLRVLGRRPDGYHEIDSLMVPVDVCDRVTVELGGTGIQLGCPGHPELDGPKNLAYRAAELFARESGADLGANMLIQKNIPIQAGLGGGSSDAAATLWALNQLTGAGLDHQTMAGLALQLGADVPFFLDPLPARARGIGQILQPLKDFPPLAFILAVAPFGLATRQVYQTLNSPLTLLDNSDTDMSPVSTRSVDSIASVLRNDLQAIGEKLHPVIGRVCKELERVGAVGASMTGSGPTVFGLFPAVKQASEALARVEREQDWQYLVARGISSGQRATE